MYSLFTNQLVLVGLKVYQGFDILMIALLELMENKD